MAPQGWCLNSLPPEREKLENLLMRPYLPPCPARVQPHPPNMGRCHGAGVWHDWRWRPQRPTPHILSHEHPSLPRGPASATSGVRGRCSRHHQVSWNEGDA